MKLLLMKHFELLIFESLVEIPLDQSDINHEIYYTDEYILLYLCFTSYEREHDGTRSIFYFTLRLSPEYQSIFHSIKNGKSV